MTERLAPDRIDPAEALSLARTALDDPGALPNGPPNIARLAHRAAGEARVSYIEQSPDAQRAYAIDRIDDALRILRDDHEPDELRAALSYHGQRLNAIADELRDSAIGPAVGRWSADRIDDGLDAIDEAIAALQPEEE